MWAPWTATTSRRASGSTPRSPVAAVGSPTSGTHDRFPLPSPSLPHAWVLLSEAHLTAYHSDGGGSMSESEMRPAEDPPPDAFRMWASRQPSKPNHMGIVGATLKLGPRVCKTVSISRFGDGETGEV